MKNVSPWIKVWEILDHHERSNAKLVLLVILLGAVSSTVMVGSVMPFLAVLSDPSRIETTPILAWIYHTSGVTSVYSFLVGLGVASFVVILVSSLIQLARAWAVARFSMMRVHSISRRLLTSYLSQSYVFFLNRHSGEMGPRILAEAQEVVSGFLRPAAEFIAAFLTTLAIVALLIWVNPLIALVSLSVIGGLYGFVYILARRSLNQLGRVKVSSNSLRHRLANEALSGIKDIKLFGCEAAYLNRYDAPSLQLASTQVHVAVVSQVPQYVLQAVALGGVILLSLILVGQTDLSSGTALSELIPVLGVFAFAGQRLMPELSKIYQSLAQMRAGAAAVDAVHQDLMLGRHMVAISHLPVKPLGLRSTLELDRVSFSYPNSDHASLHEISLTIRAGEKIGIVGSTGAGKTTLADLILGLLEPNQGRLIVDGTPISPANLRAWMQSAGYVPQDIFLTDAPVAENIALGVAPEAIDHVRLRKAGRIAQIDRFIVEELPDGYDTSIGERGVRLSGGQRQRIGIARALYHDADLIVFDEATSALDNLTEAEVMEAIDALPGDKTVLMIAHRLSTVERCDRIVVLEQGRVVGCGNWAALMKNNVSFQRIARVLAST
jgi:ATP-binding cassette, subfamily B, bacterial PglK